MELERLPVTLQRRNWLIFGILLTAQPALGELAGHCGDCGRRTGGHRRLSPGCSIRSDACWPTARTVRGARYQFGSLSRLLVMAGILTLLIVFVKINPVGLAIGLSVVVVNLLWLTLQRALM